MCLNPFKPLPPLQTKTQKLLLTAIAGIAWLAAIGVGARTLLSYENAPGKAGSPPKEWPAESRIPRTNERATLVMLAHPHCPCTRASIGELANLMARVQGRAAAYVLFLKPSGSPDGWEKSDLWQSAAAIPGVTVLFDADGAEARRFHIETSGHALLFDAAGHLLFSGGITASRGHAGENAGENALVSLLTSGSMVQPKTLVFGCPLFDPKQSAKRTICSK